MYRSKIKLDKYMNENALVYVADEQFLAPSIVSCLSFADKSLDNVDRYIFVSTKSDELIQQARKYVAQHSQNIYIEKVELAGVGKFSLLPHISASSYGRFFLRQWLKEGNCPACLNVLVAGLNYSSEAQLCNQLF